METKAIVALGSFGVLIVAGILIFAYLFTALSREKQRSDSTSAPLIDKPAYTRAENASVESMSGQSPSKILMNFVLMAACFSANHGAVTGCIGLATNRFGKESKLGADLGTWQLGTLYLTYTMSAVFGAAYVVKRLGSRDGLLAGMSIYCVYVTAFLVAALVPDETKWPVAIIGAAIGGIGGGFLWTAQGKYFVSVSNAFANSSGISTPAATSYLGGIFAFFYLYEEVVMKTLSSVIIEVWGPKTCDEGDTKCEDSNNEWVAKNAWIIVFIIYTSVSILACFGLLACHKFPIEKEDETKSMLYKLTSAGRLLFTDAKMKYMIPVNAAFGFAAGFLGAFVSGQVVHFSDKDTYAGALTAIPPAVAAVLSLVLGKIGTVTGKGPILIAGSTCFAVLAGLWILAPGLDKGWGILILCYSLMGFGRATFESTLRATFADFFSKDTDGAFANIILQSGLASALAFFLFPHFTCDKEGDYCVEYQDGSLHNVLTLEIVVVSVSVLAILGYLRAAQLHRKEQEAEEFERNMNGNMSSKV